MKRYFKVEYVKATGGQVQYMVVEFYSLTKEGEKLRQAGFAVLNCQEWK